MKNLIISCPIFIHLFITIILPLCAADPITVTIGFISSIMTIVSFFGESGNIENSDFSSNYFLVKKALEDVQLSQRLTNIERELEKIFEYLPKKIKIDSDLSDLNKGVNEIDSQFSHVSELFQKYKNGTKFKASDAAIIEGSLKSNLDSTVNHPFSTVSVMYNSLLGDSSSVLKQIDELIKENGQAPCSDPKSPQSYQQNIQKILYTLVFSQVKVSSIATMSADLLKEITGDYPIINLKLITDRVHEQYLNTIDKLKEYMFSASRDVWICDPKQHILNKTFIELINVFQKQLIDSNAIEFPNVDHWDAGLDFYGPVFEKKIDSHSGHVLYLDYTLRKKVDHDLRESALSVVNDRCSAYLWDCQHLSGLLEHKEEKTDFYVVCFPPNKNSTRRFDHITIRRGETEVIQEFGLPCNKYQKRALLNDKAVVCTCDEGTIFYPEMYRSHTYYSHRMFYTGLVESDYGNNYVVTGVRIGNYKGVLYPIIQEGKLLREGIIDEKSSRWVDLAKTNKNALKRFNKVRLGVNMTMIDYEYRTIKLGDINVLYSNELLVGIGFTDNEGPLRPYILSQAFDFKSGLLAPGFPDWIDPYIINFDSPRFNYENSTILTVDNARLPDLSLKSNSIVSDHYLNFSTSHFHTDLGQTTIPYFDTQNVTTSVLSPMVGVGFYYKHRAGTAGFIGLKLKTLDMTQGIKKPINNLPQEGLNYIAEQISLHDGILGLSNYIN